MMTIDEPRCPDCEFPLGDGIVKGNTICKNCDANVEVSVRAIIAYDTKCI